MISLDLTFKKIILEQKTYENFRTEIWHEHLIQYFSNRYRCSEIEIVFGFLSSNLIVIFSYENFAVSLKYFK